MRSSSSSRCCPSTLRRRVSALGAATTTLAAPDGPTVDPQALTVIAAACRDSERVRFAYRDRDGADSRRDVEPHSLVNVGRRWYLVAWDRAREDWRTFRLDRLTRPSSTGVRFSPREPPGGDAAAFVMQSRANAPYRYEARVTLHAPAEEIRGRPTAEWGQLEPIDDRSCEYRTSDDDLHWLTLRLAMLGVDLDVHEPPELIEHMRLLARRLGRATTGPYGSVLWT